MVIKIILDTIQKFKSKKNHLENPNIQVVEDCIKEAVDSGQQIVVLTVHTNDKYYSHKLENVVENFNASLLTTRDFDKRA